MAYNPSQFADKYQLAVEFAQQTKPEGGLCGFELEWNLLDHDYQPLLTVGSGPSQQSFVDYLRAECLPPWLREYSQLEVFHWMIEWATRPHYKPRAAVYEARLFEAALMNSLYRAGKQFNERLYYQHGNLLALPPVGPQAIPTSWHLAKRLYLERCVSLYGTSLATAGTHTNLSLPEPLLAWDFMHLEPSERGDRHLDEYKSEFYITATRLFRAFAALFIATSASTPFQARQEEGPTLVALTPYDSVRNLTFPNPPGLDVADLYRSYSDYLQLSYDLIRRGVRFGNNNWTPIRARSFAEPVERLIAITSDQLHDFYARGLYATGHGQLVDETAHQIEIQNLMARINLPMARVEIRTDDGGNPLDVEVANLTLKYLLLMRFYADPEFARAFRYDREDITRARSNEELAARDGLRAEIANPFTGKPVEMRLFVRWTLDQVHPLAEALGLEADLQPLEAMASGEPNTAEKLRSRLQTLADHEEIPTELLIQLAEEREAEIQADIATIAETFSTCDDPAARLSDLVTRLRQDVRTDPLTPVHFRPRPEIHIETTFTDKTGEVVSLAQQLIRIPSVTACPEERVDEVCRAATLVYDYLQEAGLEVRFFDQGAFPAVLAGFPGQLLAPVMLSGHVDVVPPEPDDSQFEPHIDGDYLWGRGAADMKTVVATNLVFLKDRLKQGPPYPPINLLLVGNEENGEAEPMGTPHVLARLAKENDGYAPGIFIAGERTGEKGSELYGEICAQNRGVMRFDLLARGQRGHSGSAQAGADLSQRLLQARQDLDALIKSRLTLSSPDGWQSQVRFPFIQIGTPGIYNVTADFGQVGVEIRPIPQDDVTSLTAELQDYCLQHGLELRLNVLENGIACDPANPYLLPLVSAMQQASGQTLVLGRKLPGTSARFAPGGQGIVWGQSGIGPHARDERHYIPSIVPYYKVLGLYGDKLLQIP